MPELTQHNIDSFYEVLSKIEILLKVLVRFAGVADERGRAIAEMWEKLDKQPKIYQGVSEKVTLHPTSLVEDKREYDWWLLENGQYAKIYKIELQGEVFNTNGEKTNLSGWNPYSLKNREHNKGFDLKRRREGFEPKGWPEWMK
jgi:hypothetical protein